MLACRLSESLLQGQDYVEIHSRHRPRRRPGGVAALVPRAQAEQPAAQHSPGTLLANLIGGYVIGAAIAYFAQAPGIAPEWRLLIITGFCGGLTTFSTFSAEVVSLLQEGRLGWAAGAIATHVSGSLLMTLLGLFSMNWMLGK
ncbi:Putative fluoride ion transporter CrcB [Pseudomonas aeruginosa]|nr:Putative fluoride ion transporter CrcB [Pseudomonas aeruginosa]